METKLWSALIGLSKTVDSNPKAENTDTIILDCLQRLRNHTVTQDLIDTVHKEKDKISPNVIKLRKHEKRVHFYFVLSFFNSLNAKMKSLSS